MGICWKMSRFILANWAVSANTAGSLVQPSWDSPPKCKALATGQEMDMLYIVMEYATGGDLGRRIQVPRRDTDVPLGVKRISAFHTKIPTWNQYVNFRGCENQAAKACCAKWPTVIQHHPPRGKDRKVKRFASFLPPWIVLFSDMFLLVWSPAGFGRTLLLTKDQSQ